MSGTLHGAIALRQWSNEIDDPGGYHRSVSYRYVPVGLEYAVAPGNWGHVLNFEFDAFLGGTVKSDLSDVDPGLPDAQNEQHSGYGLRGGCTARRYWANHIVTPGVETRYWHIDDSDIEYFDYGGFTYGVYQPENETTELTVQVGLEF